MAGGSVDGVTRRGLGPHLQGPHRRPARLARRSRSSAACGRGAPSCGPTTRRSTDRGDPRLDGIEVVTDPYAACDGRRRCSWCSPSGTSSSGSTSTRSADVDGRPAGRRRPQPARPRRPRGGAGSTTTASAGPERGPRSSSPAAPGSSARTSATRCSTAATRSSASTTSSPGSRRQHRAPLRPARVHLRRARRQQLRLGARRRRRGAALRQPGVAEGLPRAARSRPSRSAASAPTTRLGLAKAKGARFFLASTSEVYGDPQVHPQPETYWGHVNPSAPGRLRRGQALRRGDDDGVPPLPRPRRAHRAHLQHLRAPDAARRRAGRVELHRAGAAGQAAHRLRRRHARPAASATSTTRSRGFLALLDGDVAGPVNIGNPDEFTVLELAELVLEVTGSSSEIVFEPLPVDDPTQRQPDITPGPRPARLGAEVQLREGLERTAAWFESVL